MQHRGLQIVLGVLMLVLTGCGAGVRPRIPQVSSTERTTHEGALATLIEADGSVRGDVLRGQALYTPNCRGCHGTDMSSLGEPIAATHTNPAAVLTLISFGDAARKHPGYYGLLDVDDFGAIVAFLQAQPQR